MWRIPAARRVRTASGVLATVVVVGGLVLVGANGGYPSTRPRLLSGSAWLASAQVGQLTLLDGSSAEVAAQVQIAAPGSRLDVVQQGATGYAVNRSAGTLRRVDGATFDVSPQVTPIAEAREGLQAFAGTDALYALDAQRGVLVSADPTTLANRGNAVPLATRIEAGAATLDPAGRLWVLDNATGDLIWIDRGQRHSRRGAAAPGSGQLVLANGIPVVVDATRRVATALRPDTGEPDVTVGLDLRPNDRIQLGGSPHAARIYLVAARGILDICDLGTATCGTAVPLGATGTADLGTPVEAGGRLFVPDYATGRVWIVDLHDSQVVAKPQVLDPKTQFQLVTRDGVVFFNDPESEHAGVIRLDGGIHKIRKYNPKNPTNGVTGGPGEAPPSSDGAEPEPAPPAPSAPSAPSAPDDHPDQPAKPDTVRISMSRTTALVGEEVTVQASPRPSNAVWSFGDGHTGTGPVTTHHWDAPRTYQISVRATFPNGHSATASVTIQITARPPARPRLTVSVPGTGGTVTGGGLNCPGNCTTLTNPGATVTLTAKPAAGNTFAGWAGACDGTALTCTVTMAADRSVTASFRGSSGPPPQLRAPVLISPADGTRFVETYPRTTTLKWQAVPGAATYRVEVQCDMCGSTLWTPRINVTTTTTQYTFGWVGAQAGRWRITAIASDGTPGRTSGFWMFTYNWNGSGPVWRFPAPVQVSPQDGAVFNRYPRTTTLTWRAVNYAVKYRVEVQCDTCGSTPWTPWITTTTTATKYTFNWVGKNSGRWRVTAIGVDGTVGYSSPFWTFTYTV